MTNQEAKDILHAINFDLEPPDSPALRKAEEQLAASPELQEWFANERAFDDAIHAALSGCEIPLPGFLRDDLGPTGDPMSNTADGDGDTRFFTRRRFLIAALLTGGVSLGAYRFHFPKIPYQGAQTPISGANPTRLGDFFDFVTTYVANGFRLDFHTDSPVKGQDWIKDQNGPISPIGNTLLSMEAMGCKIIPWRDQAVSFLCLKDHDGHYIHLFRLSEVFCEPYEAAYEPVEATAKNPGSRYHLEAKRTCRIWHEPPCMCVLVPHKRGQELPTSLA